MSQSASASQNQQQQSGSAQASGSNARSGSGSASGNATSTISIPQTAAAGGITVTQPPSTASQSFYKIQENEFVTFGWNLTSLYARPTSLTVIASCGANGNTYPVGPTGGSRNTLSGNATQVVWNPWQWEQSAGATPFAEATYVLKIWDDRGEQATIRAGYLSPYSGTQFSLYRPGKYTPLSEWTCPGCNGAISAMGEPAGIAIFTTLMITFFTMWNLLRR